MNDSVDRKVLSRRRLLGYGLGTLGASVVSPALLSACGGSTSSTIPTTTGPATTTVSSGADKLLKAARAQGTVVAAAIGEPDSYYMPVVQGFEKFAGFKMDLPNPTYPAISQLDELRKARSLREKAPYDVVEVTQSIADTAAKDDLL